MPFPVQPPLDCVAVLYRIFKNKASVLRPCRRFKILSNAIFLFAYDCQSSTTFPYISPPLSLKTLAKVCIFVYNMITVIGGELAVPCICNPLQQSRTSFPGVRMEGRAPQGVLITRSCATQCREPCQDRDVAALSGRLRVPQGSFAGATCCVSASVRTNKKDRTVFLEYFIRAR